MTLEGNWEVVEKITKRSSTGGHFSTGYRVRNSKDGREGFLKAMDYSAAFESSDPRFISVHLQQLTEAYNFEKSLCERCRGNSMRRVVHAIDSGTLRLHGDDKFSIVEYLIFDLADGDIRGYIETQNQFDVAFALRSLHHVATALHQLHRHAIAHQDLKPSNVLVFLGSKESKIGDLGRAWSKDLPGPHDGKEIPGDATYAPPEFLYQNVPTEVAKRRFGSDLYYFGNLIVFYFTRSHVNALLNKHLASGHRYHRWRGPYSEILPYLLEAFAKVLQEFRQHVAQDYLRDRLCEMVSHLCDPDPTKRGHPLNRHGAGNQHSLERFMSALDLLAFKAETNLTKRIIT